MVAPALTAPKAARHDSRLMIFMNRDGGLFTQRAGPDSAGGRHRYDRRL
jgi:hypothetical protein